MADDLPQVPVRIGEERVGPTQRSGGGRLDDHPAGPGRHLDRGGDLGVAGDMDGQDRLGVRLTLQRGGDLFPAELGEQLVGAHKQQAAGVLNSDMAGVEAADSSQPSAV
jgi:hypothetical protein